MNLKFIKLILMKAASVGELAGTRKITFLQNVLGQATTNTRKLALALLKFKIFIFYFYNFYVVSP